MLKKRLTNIAKLSVLIAVRQIWGWLCNLYLLTYQPFLTIRTLKAKKDKSQIFLLAVTALMPVAIYLSARLVWDMYKYGRILTSVGEVFLAMTIIEILIFGYLGYWVIEVFRKNHIDSFEEK